MILQKSFSWSARACFIVSSFALLMAAPACGGDDGGETDAGTSAGPDASTTNATSDGGATSTTAGSDGGSSSSGANTTTSTTDAPTTGTTAGTTSEDTTNPDGAPNGSPCTASAECMSGKCYNVPLLGGQCGECEGDADCDGGGCTPPNPFGMDGPTCNMGELGGGCETTEVCMDGLSCATVLDILGLVTISTCGNCSDDSDCGDQICAPLVNVDEFSGFNECIDAGSVPQDGFCNVGANGDAACESGICSEVDIMGLASVGSCGECSSDADCGGGTCQAGAFDFETGVLTGSTCV